MTYGTLDRHAAANSLSVRREWYRCPDWVGNAPVRWRDRGRTASSLSGYRDPLPMLLSGSGGMIL